MWSYRLVFVVCLIMMATSSQSKYFRVDVTAPSGGDGMTWATAFNTIQDGVDAAGAGAGTEVWVARGSYSGIGGLYMVDDQSAGECVVLLADNVHLYGGFIGTETERSQRNWVYNRTVIDGMDVRRCVGGANSCILDGFILEDGNATAPSLYQNAGGGLFCHNDSVEVSNCQFTFNTATYGGAVYNYSSSPSLSSCYIINNDALKDGGAIYNEMDSSPAIVNCLILGNEAVNNGGGFNNKDSSLLEVMNCTIVGNHASEAGSVVNNTSQSIATFTNSILWWNYIEQFSDDSDSRTVCQYSCVEEGYPGTGNIADYPGFSITGKDVDYHIDESSACVDAGTLDGAPDVDLEGITRPQGMQVDMGVYEFVHSPPRAVCQDISLELDASGNATLEAADIDGGSMDDIRIVEMTISRESFSCEDFGDHSVTLSVTDTAGLTDSCTATVTVVDITGPVIKLNGDPLVVLQVGDTYTEPGATALDACSQITTIHIGGDLVDTETIGVYEVAYDAEDERGNFGERIFRTVVVSRPWREVWYVDSQGNAPEPNGTSWDTAFHDIQSAITAAGYAGASESTPSEIWVAGGVYTGVGGIARVNVESAGECVVVLSEGIELYGGFSGNETLKSERDWVVNATVIDGQSLRRCIGGDKFSVLDGFSVINGNATGNEEYGNRGGGIFNFGDSVDIRNCLFKDNIAEYGGGIYNHYASPKITNCSIIENEALKRGGGIDNVTNSSPVITNCLIVNNMAEEFGGGINNYNSSSPQITNCTIIENYCGESGGVLFNHRNSSPTIMNCILWDNTSGIVNEDTGSIPVVGYSCVQGGYRGVGVFDSDPLFVHSSTGDYRLNRNSPCIDTASQDEAPQTDILGVQRPLGHGVDMGVYEINPLHPIAIAEGGVVELGPDGTIIVTPEDFDFGSSDDVEIVTMSLSRDSFTCDDIGENQVVFTVTDGDNHTDSCSIILTVVDVTPPVITLLGSAELTIELGGDYRGSAAEILDECDQRFPVGISGDKVNTQVAGVYIITFHATDNSGNEAVPVSRTVRVEAVWRDVWYVNQNCATETPNGVSWETAFQDIQSAIELAISTGTSEESPSEIWVAGGIYSGVGGVVQVGGVPSGECVVMLKEGIHLYGGFTGIETTLSQRDWRINHTTIDGENTRRCVGGANHSLLHGFTIRNGRATGPEDYGHRGGGIINFGANPDLVNCIFIQNVASYGAGVYNHYASPNITNCYILDNEALMHAGGMDNVTTSSPVLTNCIVAGNTAVKKGGGINNFNFSSPVLMNCTIIDNTAGDYGGGVFNNTDCSPEITNCIIWNNTDGVYNVGDGSVPTVSYCCVQGGYEGEGNIDDDPLLADPENGYFTLSPISPCINAGTVEGAPAEDFTGNPRHVGPSVDMGAMEYVPKTGWFIH